MSKVLNESNKRTKYGVNPLANVKSLEWIYRTNEIWKCDFEVFCYRPWACLDAQSKNRWLNIFFFKKKKWKIVFVVLFISFSFLLLENKIKFRRRKIFLFLHFWPESKTDFLTPADLTLQVLFVPVDLFDVNKHRNWHFLG